MHTNIKLRLCLFAFAISPFAFAASWTATPAQTLHQSGPATPPPQTAKPLTQVDPPDPSTPPHAGNSSKLSQHEQIQADTKMLYQLALEFRTEVGKTYRQSLSVDVLRKAQELEKLARTLKSEMDHEASAKKR